MANQPSSPRPETINRFTGGVLPAMALVAGMQLDLFSPLHDGHRTAIEVAAIIGADPGKLELLMYALVTAGLLEVKEGVFSNTAEANQFLVKGKEGYMGNRAGFFHARWSEVLNTAASVRKGQAQAKLEFASMSEDDLESFLRGLHPETVAAGRSLVNKFDFSTTKSVADIGGGSGGLAISLVEANPQLNATVIDLPTVTAISQRIVEEAGASDRVQVMAADAVEGPISGPYDAVVMRAFIQVLSEPEIRSALGNANRILSPGGEIYILGRILENSRVSPAESAFFNLVFLNVYDAGQAYTEHQYRDWLAESGFKGFTHEVQPNGSSIVTARKAG